MRSHGPHVQPASKVRSDLGLPRSRPLAASQKRCCANYRVRYVVSKTSVAVSERWGMSVRDKVRWKEWADDLRQTMMAELTPYVTKSVEEIIKETATEKSASVLGTQKFWKACQAGKGTNDTLSKAGFEIEFESNAEGKVATVTLHLNDTWKAIMQRVLDRRAD